MSTAGTTTSGSKLKDLMVTAAVASVVSAVVAPWIRRWMDGPEGTPSTGPRSESPTDLAPTDDYEQRLERLLKMPDPSPGDLVSAFRSPPARRDTHVED